MVLAFRKEIVKKSPPPSSSSTFENVKYKCPFITCATIFKTTSELKRHLFRHHTDVKKDCIYLGCSYFTSNSNTLRVCYFMFSNVILTFVLFFCVLFLLLIWIVRKFYSFFGGLILIWKCLRLSGCRTIWYYHN